MKLKNSNFDKTKKLKLLQNSITQILTKHSNCEKKNFLIKMRQNSKNQIMTKRL